MPTFDEMYDFLKEHYINTRFEGKNNDQWGDLIPKGKTYSMIVTQSALDDLEKYGIGRISPFEAASGRMVEYDKNFTILNPDAPRAQIGKKAGNLTHIYGASW